jgi:hypothetical protein
VLTFFFATRCHVPAPFLFASAKSPTMSVSAFTVEAWNYLAIDIIVVATRALARWQQMGIRGMSPDDILMIIAIVGICSQKT